ncbi:MAG: hypothetical protein A2V66_15850 [Ignavibacteria bacterium RBG_13_36_8]|nr:MAG: hypothetical protein A2V66_15850 [Ignavibacteria bacterium RBG_13_36_8]
MDSTEKNKAQRIRLTLIFFLLICLATAISVIMRKSGYSFPGWQNLMILILLIALGLFGWLSVRRCNSSLIQNVLFGLILSFGSHWSLLFFHKGWEILQLLVINSAIFAFVSFLGGCLAVVFNKSLGAKKRK